eukprot:CAMPEP_0170843686 /NCGR_PEP_ID=MMETSP0734-20130129/6407_1 /TAXON_ID=186038 /ORGANISM="Fragilariopsis kerguelensis, Strain L26-C5" /LENGTH=126 /DNA_ID=CAMNT_0011211905 /DNA_START=206 /DNA_END=583 /DNA_ORIENTATION=-
MSPSYETVPLATPSKDEPSSTPVPMLKKIAVAAVVGAALVVGYGSSTNQAMPVAVVAFSSNIAVTETEAESDDTTSACIDVYYWTNDDCLDPCLYDCACLSKSEADNCIANFECSEVTTDIRCDYN